MNLDEIPVYSRPGILIIKFQYFPSFLSCVQTAIGVWYATPACRDDLPRNIGGTGPRGRIIGLTPGGTIIGLNPGGALPRSPCLGMFMLFICICWSGPIWPDRGGPAPSVSTSNEKVWFYIAQYPVGCSIRHQLDFSRKHSAILQYCSNDIHSPVHCWL